MKKSLIFICSLIMLTQAYAQKESRILEWSIGKVELTRGKEVQVRYPLMVAISESHSRPQLGTSTLRLFYDAGYLEGLHIENIENGYDVNGLNESKDVFGKAFGFVGGGGIFAQLDILANQMDPLDLSTEPVHVLDFSFTVKTGAKIPLCASLVLDNNIEGSKKGKDKDAGYLVNDSGIVGTYFLNNNTQKAWLADDEVANYLWEINPSSDHVVDNLNDRAGFMIKEKSKGCLEPKIAINAAELFDFKAIKKDKNLVLLDWTTDSEFNNDFFEIERSEDGFLFESIGRVKGKWNTITATSYNFLDEEAKNGPNYYRLKQVDNNGKVEYSPVNMVQFDADFSTDELKISYYPNPTKGVTNILSSTSFDDFDLLVFDAIGRLVMEKQGIDSDAKLDLTALESGAYTLTLKNSSHQTVSSQALVIIE